MDDASTTTSWLPGPWLPLPVLTKLPWSKFYKVKILKISISFIKWKVAVFVTHHDGFQELPKRAPTTSAGGWVEGGHELVGSPFWQRVGPISDE